MSGCNPPPPPWAHPTAQRRCRQLRRPRAHYGGSEGPAARQPQDRRARQSNPPRASGQWLVGGVGVVGDQIRGVAPPTPPRLLYHLTS